MRFDRRSRFYRRLRNSGLRPGQIQHIVNLYNKDESRRASRYMREHGVSEYRRRATREQVAKHKNLFERAAQAKERKLGTRQFMDHATTDELHDMINLSTEELKKRAAVQRKHNPFWYHTHRSYTERVLGHRRAA